MIITYHKKTKHRKKCRWCGQLIQDGMSVKMHKLITEKWYPVKGLMKFSKWIFTHEECWNKQTQG